jgi:hypothetical protein
MPSRFVQDWSGTVICAGLARLCMIVETKVLRVVSPGHSKIESLSSLLVLLLQCFVIKLCQVRYVGNLGVVVPLDANEGSDQIQYRLHAPPEPYRALAPRCASVRPLS